MGRAYQNRKDSIAKTSDANAKVYSRFSREIYVCAKSGGVDPDGNLALRGLLERAKKSQVPSHVIEKALDKAKGGGGENYSPARYEGYGPGGCAVIIDCLTDNPNRTFGELRGVFTKAKCKIGTQGCVSHTFDHLAILVFKGDDEEATLDALLGADIDVTDIENENGMISLFIPPNEYANAKQALQDAFGEIDFEVDDIQFLPQATTKLAEEDAQTFEKFIDMLNDVEDVQNVYHNVET